MVEVTTRRHPGIPFRAADMRALPADDGEWGGIVAFYSVIHVPDLSAVFREFARVLRPDGTALVSFHVGDEVRHVEKFLGRTISLDFHFFTRPTVEAAMAGAGLEPRAYLERRSYPAEVETTRGYLLARRA
ncbi:MAG: class I SAM-dependent methyltransferase [Streptosporangiales bacterium]|nr:class I SAM-dependent methyltransferase [Streptosporangiales bacterium]